MRIFSGIQPTGAKHLGNYSGGFRQYAADPGDRATRSSASSICTRSRSTTIPHDLRERTLDLAAMLFATGLDPERSTVFVPEPRDRARRGGLAAVGGDELRPARPDDAVQGQVGAQQEFISAGLFTYPILMAGDILLYQTDLVPIGDDQRQHLELTRDIAERFNSRFGETFTVPDGVYPEVGARIMDLQEPDEQDVDDRRQPTQGTIHLARPARGRAQEAQDGRHRLRAARSATTRPRRPGISNLIEIMTVATGESIAEVERRYEGVGYGQFKSDVAEAVVELLETDPDALPRAARRSRRARADAGSRRRQGERGFGADAGEDVRANGFHPTKGRVSRC